MRAIDTPKHWRDRAEEMRILSGLMHEAKTAVIMIHLAEDYDKMADRAEKRHVDTVLVRRPVRRD